MGMGMENKLVCVVVAVGMVMMMMVEVESAGVTCGMVSSGLSPCLNYLRGMSRGLPPACCAGVRNINNAARTTPDRRMACNCIKSAASRISGINPNLASSLPSNCGVNIPYKISPNTDCNSVK